MHKLCFWKPWKCVLANSRPIFTCYDFSLWLSFWRVQRVFLQHFNNCKSWTFCSIQTIICQNDKRRKLYHVDRPLLLWITEAVPSLGRFYQPRTANNEVNNSILALTRNCGHMTMNRILHAYFMTSKKL